MSKVKGSGHGHGHGHGRGHGGRVDGEAVRMPVELPQLPQSGGHIDGNQLTTDPTARLTQLAEALAPRPETGRPAHAGNPHLPQRAETAVPPRPETALPQPPRSETALPQPPRSDPRNGYNPHALLDTQAQLRGETTVKQPVQNLVPDLKRTENLATVRERFTSDYALLKPQVVDVPNTTPKEKATRAFEFFSAYAARFVAVATGEAAKPPPDPHPEAIPLQAEIPNEPPVQAVGEEAQLQGDAEGGEEGRFGKLLRFPLQRTREGEGLRTLRDELMLQGRLSGKGPEAQLPSRAELRSEAQAFAHTLRDLGFDAMRDAATGKDGLQLAYEMLTSKSSGEVAQKTSTLQLEAESWPPPPPTAEPEAPRELERPRRESEPLIRSQVKKDLGESPNELDRRVEFERTHGSPETFRVQSWSADAGRVVIQAPAEQHLPDELAGDGGAIVGRLTDKKLGRNMVWNLLHQLRGEGADSAVEQSNWDKLTFAAIALLGLITLGVVALVAL